MKKQKAKEMFEPVRVMWQKSKLNSDGGDYGSKKYKQGYAGTYGGVW
jgi:hypothetical protein